MLNNATFNAMKTFFAGILVFISFAMYAQDRDPALLTVGKEKVTKTDFVNIYQKNNIKGDAMDRKSLEEYLDLYINFKLKVLEAEEFGLDTLKTFKDELAGYRKQLAQPYLIDEDINKYLLDESYARKQFDIRASHILVKLDKNAPPKDTLEAYNKIMKIRKRILAGETFENLAVELSDDLSAKDDIKGGRTIPGNKGDLGYFSAFDMVYPFENGAYNTKVGEISMPVRSDYGYHLIKVIDKKPAMGKVQIAHILLLYPKNVSSADMDHLKAKADSIYGLLTSGTDFAQLAKETSDDKSTATKGGIMPWFGSNRMIPDFIYQISKLQNKGDVTPPFSTHFGWHIIKLIDRKPIGSFEETKAELKQALAKSDRNLKSKESLIHKIKKEYFFTEDLKSKNEFVKVMDTTVFAGKWDVAKAAGLTKNLFLLGDKTFTQKDFADYISKNQKSMNKQDLAVYIDNAYKIFTDESCLAYEDNQLENKYPEFRSLMKEYRDGILLFDLTDRKIWSKAVKDSTGLQEYYNKNKTNYMWGNRLDASVYTLVKTSSKDLKKARKMASKGIDEAEILKTINHDSTVVLSIDHKKFSKGDNPQIDGIAWEKSVTKPVVSGDTTIFVAVHQNIPPEPKLLGEIKGLVTADYQNYLEKEWIKSLRQKYPISVNKEVFNSIIKE
ncbi:MAG: peptidylprolyl isomerase [Lentimicrobiaceae bacterium]|nr:peptidylprolyl isomerase [Lentimicrobiaceae bacterium]